MKDKAKLVVAVLSVVGSIYLLAESAERRHKYFRLMITHKLNEMRIPSLSYIAISGTDEQSKWALDELDAMFGIGK